MFKHDDSPLLHSSRRASRRLHRRPSLPAMALSAQHGLAPSPAAGRRPHAHVRHADVSRVATPMMELLAAETRIGELERALSEARAAALTDTLTGALNRRGFDAAYQRELARARRHGGQLALALIDIDDFKRLNDTLGHHVGDEALVHLVKVLRAALRPSDLLCRFGGEEFVLLLPDTALNEAAAAVSRFQGQLAANRITDNKEVFLTFSAGVVVQGLDEALEDSLRRADAATYAAKRAGKNCVVTG